jgi:predicted DNA-binding ribbon-helix-helix protein
MKKRSVKILGHATSISLEEPFWEALKTEAERREISLNALIAKIDEQRPKTGQADNLSSAIRLYILQQLQTRLLQ